MKRTVQVKVIFMMVLMFVFLMQGIPGTKLDCAIVSNAADYTNNGCVRWVKDRAAQIGITLPSTGKNKYNLDGASAYWDTLSSYPHGSEPAPNALAVWEYNNGSDGAGGKYGHVAFVESVDGDNVTVTEGGCKGYSYNGHTGVIKRTQSKSKMATLGNCSGFYGYIYLTGGGSGTPINLGDSFNAIILRTDIWRPICVKNDDVVLADYEQGIASEHWKFTRQSDGSYTIQSLYNGKMLDVRWGENADNANVWVYDQESTDNSAQKWYIYGSGTAYKLVPQCAMGRAMDVAGGGTNGGTNIQIYTQNGTASQIFSIYKIPDNPVPDITEVAPSVSVSATGLMTASFSSVFYVHHYDVVLQGTNHQELNYVNVGTNTSGSLQLPRYGVYYVKVNAYGANGVKTSSILTRCVWAGPRVDVESDVITMIKSKKGRYLYADTDNNVVKVVDEIDYNNLDNYFFKIVRQNDNNDIVIYSMANGKVLTVDGDSIVSGKKIGLSIYAGTSVQTFAIKNNYEMDAYVIYPSGQSYILDTGDSSGSLYIYDYTHYANDNQYFNLLKLDMNPSVYGFNGEYDGKEHEITIGGIPEDATIEYKIGSEGTWSTKHPTCKEVGSYDVDYKIEHDYYTTYTGSMNITIKGNVNDSEQDNNMDNGKSDSEQDSSIDAGENDFGQDDNQNINEEIKDSQEELDPEELGIAVTDIKLNKTNIELSIGEEVCLQAVVQPDNAVNKNIIWSSDDASIATVDKDGNVTGVAAGTTKINVEACDGTGVKNTCVVTVIKADAPTDIPTDIPTDTPSQTPTDAPTNTPSQKPTDTPNQTPDTGGQVSQQDKPADGNIWVDYWLDGIGYSMIENENGEIDVEILNYKGTDKSLFIPEYIFVDDEFYDVTSIADNAFKNNRKLTYIVIGDNVKTIGKNAFSGCTNLKKVEFGRNLKRVGYKAFYNCKKLTKVIIPSKVTQIDSYAFKNCKKLSSVTIGKSVKTIGKEAFKGCGKLKSVNIRSTKLKTVGKNAIKGIDKKATIKVLSKQFSRYRKLFKNKTGYKKTMKIKKI